MKNIEERRKREKVRHAASLIKCMSEELTSDEIEQVIRLEHSIIKRVSKK